MKTAFIIAEYNPFHNGHRYHIEQTKNNGADAVVAIMSGNFVQRGEPACAQKHKRAEATINNGADLVLELPVKYALSSADNFASGGIEIACACGLEGVLSFGASADKETLGKLAELKSQLIDEEISEYTLSHGCTYATAVDELLRAHGADEELIFLLGDANNILGIEYIKALKRYENPLEIYPVKRIGAMHESNAPEGSFASGSYIRKLMNAGDEWNNFVPANSISLYENRVNFNKFSSLVSGILATKNSETFALCDGVTAGLENRITEAVKNCNSFEETCQYIKSKRYPFSRIRRILCASALGITKQDLQNGPSYIRVLGANSKGRDVLREMKTTASLPVISNLSEITADNKKALRDAELDYLAGKIFNLCLNEPSSGNTEYNIPPYFE